MLSTRAESSRPLKWQDLSELTSKRRRTFPQRTQPASVNPPPNATDQLLVTGSKYVTYLLTSLRICYNTRRCFELPCWKYVKEVMLTLKNIRLLCGSLLAIIFFISCSDSSVLLTKHNSKQVTFTLENMTSANSGGTALSTPTGISISNAGEQETRVLNQTGISFLMNLAAGWEVMDWTVFPTGHQTTGGGQDRTFAIHSISDDMWVKVKIRQRPFVNLTVRVKGGAWGNDDGGAIEWKAYPPGSNFSSDFGHFNTGTLADNPWKETRRSYKNGTRIRATLLIGGFGNVKQELPEITLDDDKVIAHDFKP